MQRIGAPPPAAAAALAGLDAEISQTLSLSEDADEKRRIAIASAVLGRCYEIEKIAI